MFGLQQQPIAIIYGSTHNFFYFPTPQLCSFHLEFYVPSLTPVSIYCHGLQQQANIANEFQRRNHLKYARQRGICNSRAAAGIGYTTAEEQEASRTFRPTQPHVGLGVTRTNIVFHVL